MTGARTLIVRWGACFALAICFHAAGGVALLTRWNENADAVANAAIITIELASLPVAPDIKPTELPPGPQQTEAQPEPASIEPVQKVEIPPDPQAEPVLAVTPPPKPIEKREKKPRHLHASLARAPTNAELKAERAAAPPPGATSRDANAVPNWKSLLVATLERNKRYPLDAEAHGDQGVAELAFSVDRHGGVHNARIARSSGSSLLDRETLAMLQRAAPLPPPPPEVSGAEIPIVVPIRYNIR